MNGKPRKDKRQTSFVLKRAEREEKKSLSAGKPTP